MDEVKEVWLPLLLAVLLAALGGFLGSMIRTLDAGLRFNWVVVLLETAASAFAGVTVMLLCSYAGLDYRLSGAIVAVCGWFGGRITMGWLEQRVAKIVKGGKE